jgi:DNA-binding MarR family transcriptional regulator
MRVRMLNRVVTDIYDQGLRPVGLKASQLNVLVAVAKLQVAHPSVVCRILRLDESTLSRNVERMKAKGWLRVEPGDDARTQPLRLTSSGKRLLARAVPAWERAQRLATKELADSGVTLPVQPVKLNEK